MSKATVIQKERKRFLCFNKYYNKLKFLKNSFLLRIKENKSRSFFDNLDIIEKIQKLPKNSHGSRIKNRCFITGRARGVYRRFGLSKYIIREISSKGYAPGLQKSSC